MEEKKIIGLVPDEIIELDDIEEAVDISHDDNGIGEDNE